VAVVDGDVAVEVVMDDEEDEIVELVELGELVSVVETGAVVVEDRETVDETGVLVLVYVEDEDVPKQTINGTRSKSGSVMPYRWVDNGYQTKVDPGTDTFPAVGVNSRYS
jgi:hypothetical protein